jgi:U6 snRNA-associated Sm-like protein LSm7
MQQALPTTGGSLGSDKPKREAILDLSKYVDERIRVKFTGGREGILDFLSRFQILTRLRAVK